MADRLSAGRFRQKVSNLKTRKQATRKTVGLGSMRDLDHNPGFSQSESRETLGQHGLFGRRNGIGERPSGYERLRLGKRRAESAG